MKVGLVGFAGAGKTVVFSALTGTAPAPGKGALGAVKVPDSRVDQLALMCRPRKTTYAEILFEDYPPGSFGGEGGAVAPAVLGEMRNLDVLAEVVDAFSGGGVQGVSRLATAFRAELMLSDLAIIERRLERVAKESGRDREKAMLVRCRETLESDRELRELDLDAQTLASLTGYRFLTLKPRVIVANVGEDEVQADVRALQVETAAAGVELVLMSAPLEVELGRLPSAERKEFLASYGLEAGARDRFIARCYALLDLVTFLTAGDDEVRAWPVRRGSTAVDAAGKIHSDIARGFIRAEVIALEDYTALGGEAGCRQAGRMKMQGKDYVIADGDVVHFRFNV